MCISAVPLMLAGVSGEDVGLAAIIVGAIMIIAVTGIISVQRRKGREAAYNARLKQIMLERGMSADEIARVVAAGRDEDIDAKILGTRSGRDDFI
jgi:pilus assembly protein TadC